MVLKARAPETKLWCKVRVNNQYKPAFVIRPSTNTHTQTSTWETFSEKTDQMSACVSNKALKRNNTKWSCRLFLNQNTALCRQGWKMLPLQFNTAFDHHSQVRTLLEKPLFCAALIVRQEIAWLESYCPCFDELVMDGDQQLQSKRDTVYNNPPFLLYRTFHSDKNIKFSYLNIILLQRISRWILLHWSQSTK